MPAAPVIDLNADLGEEAGHDEALLAIVTSANVSCGAHAGGPSTAVRTIREAAARAVVVGAHPGHADREHFGRRALPITPRDLERLLHGQLATLATAAAAARGSTAATAPRYLKLHGALYHQVAESEELSAATVRIAQLARLAVLGPPGSVLLARARAVGLGAIAEGFVDRGYELAGGRPHLIARGAPGAMLEPAQAVEQAVRLATTGTVRTPSDGRVVDVPVRSLCVHGDNPDAVRLARAVREALERVGVQLRAFAA